MKVAPGRTASDGFNLRVENYLINFGLRFGEAAVCGKSPRHVAREITELCARVNQQQVAVFDALIVGRVMQHGRVRARCDDRRIAVSRASLFAKDVSQHGFNLVLVHPRPERAKRGYMSIARDVYGAAQHFKIVARFNEPHLVQQLSRINHRSWPDAVALALALKVAHPSDKPLVKRGVAAETIVNAVSLSNELRQFLVELVNRESGVGPVIALRSFFARAPARPHFALAIFRLNEESEAMFRVLRHKHCDGIWLFKSCEVIKVRILAIFVLDIVIANCSRRSRKDGRASADALHKLFASLPDLLFSRSV